MGDIGVWEGPDPLVKDLTKLIASNLRDNFDWFSAPKHDGKVKLLDYACGNGVASIVNTPGPGALCTHLKSRLYLVTQRQSLHSSPKPSESTFQLK